MEIEGTAGENVRSEEYAAEHADIQMRKGFCDDPYGRQREDTGTNYYKITIEAMRNTVGLTKESVANLQEKYTGCACVP